MSEKLSFYYVNFNTVMLFHIIHNSQPSVNDDRVSLDGEAKNPGIFRCVSEDDLFPLCVLFREKTDFWDAVVLKEDREHPLMSCNGENNRL